MPNGLLTYFKQTRHRFVPGRWVNALLAATLLLLLAIVPVTAQAPSPRLGSAGYMPQLVPDEETPVPLLDSAAAKQKVYLPALNKLPAACTLKANPNFFGVQMYGATDSSSPYYPWLKASGADWIRILIPWNSVEPTNTTPDKYNWRAADRLLAAAIEGCYHIIGTHSGDAAWTGPGPVTDPAIRADLLEYLTALVERYDGDGIADAPGSPVVDFWEIYNEPDASAFLPGISSWGEFGKAYADTLCVIYPAVKQANPNVKVLLGGLAYDAFIGEQADGKFVRGFLGDVLDAGGYNCFDFMNFHSFAAELSNNWTPPGLIEKTQDVRAIFTAHGVQPKPVIITETGWHSNDYLLSNGTILESDQETQARYIAELYAQAKVMDIKLLINFTLYDLLGHAFDSGLVTSASFGSVQPKLALKAFQTSVNMLGNAEYVAKVKSHEAYVEAYEFADRIADRTIYVAWANPVRSTDKESLTLPVYGADLYDIYNNFLGTLAASDGTLTIKVTAQPVYVIEK